MTAVAEERAARDDAAPPRRIPYKGLAPYGEHDHAYFFGRATWRGIIVDHLFAYRVTLLYGPSGVGKSSVLGAGVIHDLIELARRNIEVSGRPELVPVLVAGWSGDPLATVEAAIADAVRALSPELAEAPPEGTFAELLSMWAMRAGGPVLLVLDQFDEFFMYHDADRATGGFALVDALADAVGDPSVPVNVLISIREDALAKLDRFEDRLPDLWQNLLRIDHLDCDAAREAIERPIERWNARYADGDPILLEDGLVDAVLAEADTRSVRIGKAGRGVLESPEEHRATEGLVEAPYLQLVMTRLWEEELKRKSRTLRVDTLARMGGSDQIVRRHFDSVMRSLKRRQRGVAARILEYLVTPAGTKIALPAVALAKWSKQKESKVAAVLAMLASGDRRILRTVSAPGDGTGGTSYEIFHDRLAAGILDWRRRYARRRRRRRIALVATPLVLLAALGAWVAVQRQNNQLSSRIDVLNSRVGDIRNRFTAAQQIVKIQTRLSPSFGAFLPPHDDWVNSVAFSPDGRHVATASADATVIVANASSGAHERTIHTDAVDGGVTRVAYSPDGKLLGVETGEAWGGVWDDHRKIARVAAGSSYNSLTFAPDGRGVASASENGIVVVHDARTGARMRTYGHSGPQLGTIALSRDGALVAASGQRRARVWSTRTGKLLATLTLPARPVDVAFSPDSRRLLTVGPKRALLWDVRTWHSVPLDGAPPWIGGSDVNPDLGRVADFSRDGLVVVAGGRDAVVSNVEGKRVAVLHGAKQVTTIARFSPNGELVATGAADGATRVWQARSGALLATLSGQSGTIVSLAFAPDGGRLATASSDGTTVVWRLRPNVRVSAFLANGRLKARVWNSGPARSSRIMLRAVAGRAVHVGALAPGTARFVTVPGRYPGRVRLEIREGGKTTGVLMVEGPITG